MKRIISLFLCLLLCWMIAPVRTSDAEGMTIYINDDILTWTEVPGAVEYTVNIHAPEIHGSTFSRFSDKTSLNLVERMGAYPSATYSIWMYAYDGGDNVIAESQRLSWTFDNPYQRVTKTTIKVDAPVIGAEPDKNGKVTLDHGGMKSCKFEWRNHATDKLANVFEENQSYELRVYIELDDDTYLAFSGATATINGIPCDPDNLGDNKIYRVTYSAGGSHGRC